jgi:hypothetical protein
MKRRALAFAAIFWTLLATFIAFDWSRARPPNPFDEPPPWALGQTPGQAGAHCAAPLK